jgi:signal transduction histidine kinase
MGAIVIAFPIEETRDKIIINRSILIAAAIVTAILSMIVFYALFRWVFVQPVQHLRTVAERVAAGDLHVRADISTGDEFENLARTFNRMLQALDSSREQLRQANVSLDHKLEELARANVSLFEMNQMKSKFLTTMSHELRTPLNAIIGFAEILRENRSISEDSKLSRYVGNIQSSGHLLLDIINDLLDLAKIEAGKVEIKLSRVSPLDIGETAMNMVRPMVGGRSLALELDIAAECPIMTTDANKLQQILYNLLSNAVKFTPAGTVRLTVRPIDAETLLFQVSDTGPGLTAEQQKIIFDRFSQVDQGHTRQYGGTGLGLSIVRELVDVLGGDVAVQSTPGEGATFNVTLPLVAAAEPAATAERVPVTHVDSRSEPRAPSAAMAPAPVTAEDTVVAGDIEIDPLDSHAGDGPDRQHDATDNADDGGTSHPL